MNNRQCNLLLGWMVVSRLVIITLLICVLLLVLLPRATTRQVRHRLADAVLWQWVKQSKLLARLHGWLWSEGNGKHHQA